MKYVRSILAADEKILAVAGFHWSYSLFLLWLLIVAIAPLAALWLLGFREDWYLGAAGVWMLWFLYRVLRLMLERWTTERVVTDRRIIAKHGIIARHSSELPLERVEEVDLRQSILGRLLGYGNLLVSGTGGDDKLIFANIDEPVAFQRAIAEARSRHAGHRA